MSSASIDLKEKKNLSIDCVPNDTWKKKFCNETLEIEKKWSLQIECLARNYFHTPQEHAMKLKTSYKHTQDEQLNTVFFYFSWSV